MIVTAKRIPVPLPIAPIKSAKIVNNPMHIPPKVAAAGIVLFNYSKTFSSLSLIPSKKYWLSLKLLAISLPLLPDNSTQVLEKSREAYKIKITAVKLSFKDDSVTSYNTNGFLTLASNKFIKKN